MPIVHLIRHGKATPSQASYDQLHPKGREQAWLLGAYFADECQGFGAVFCGPLLRQRDTLQLMRDGAGAVGAQWPVERQMAGLEEAPIERILRELLPVRAEEDPALAELFVQVEDAAQDRAAMRVAVMRVYSHMIRLWMAGEVAAPGLETSAQFRARVLSSYHAIVSETGAEDHVAVVTSSGVIAAIVEHLEGVSETAQLGPGIVFANSSVTRLEVMDGQARIAARDRIPHLRDPSLVTHF